MIWDMTAFDGNNIDIRWDILDGLRIGIYGRDGELHRIVLTPVEAIKVRNALDRVIDEAITGTNRFACKGLADLDKEASE